jgi:beta-lactamase class A
VRELRAAGRSGAAWYYSLYENLVLRGDHSMRVTSLRLTIAAVVIHLLTSNLALAEQNLRSRIEDIAAKHHGKVALFAQNFKTGETVVLDPDVPVPTASVIKLTILLEAMDEVRNGHASLDEKIVLKKGDQVAGSGMLGLMDTPMTLTLKDVLTLMIVVSDNTATNLAIDRLGIDKINAHTRDLGLKDTYLYKKVFRQPEGVVPADQPKFGLGKTTAREMAFVISRIGLCQLGTPEHRAVATDGALCDVMLGMLRSQFYRDGIPRYIEGLDSSESGSAIANKTGAVDAARSDIALIASKNGLIVISAFTYQNVDQSYSTDDEGDVTIAKLGQAILQAWSGNGLDSAAFLDARKPGYRNAAH